MIVVTTVYFLFKELPNEPGLPPGGLRLYFRKTWSHGSSSRPSVLHATKIQGTGENKGNYVIWFVIQLNVILLKVILLKVLLLNFIQMKVILLSGILFSVILR
jgi:hypothetical protein